jgi:hypothetical protein
MVDQIVALFTWLFELMGNVSNSFDTYAGVTSASGIIGTVATSIKPVGYALLALFAMLEMAQLSERVGNVNGFMGAGLVINVLVKLLLCKLVVDNSTEICAFVMSITDQVTSLIGNTTITSIDIERFKTNLTNAFPNWWDIFGQLGFFIVSLLFVGLSSLAIIATKIIFAARFIELYVLTAVSPIPLSTCLSKHFNAAPNFIKTLLAVGLQGALLLLVLKIFNVIFVYQINHITITAGDWGSIWGMLGTILFNSMLLLVSAFMTQRWAKSICHAM